MSHDFTMSSMWTSKDPLVVLRDSSDGNERHKALAALQEPQQHGGSQKDQETVMQILEMSAKGDQQALCRMAALRTLGRFKDPRAADILDQVYLQPLPFPSDINGMVRQQCLTSLAETGGPIALKRLILVAKEPQASEKAPEAVKQETLDRRLAAVRGLAKFKDPEAAATLAYLMKSEKDIAMKDRAHESLQACTGKHLPPDSPQWSALIQPAMPSAPSTGVVPVGSWNEAKTKGPG
jgi:hypothetical protein